MPSIGGAPQSALEMGIANAFRTSSTGLYLFKFKFENRAESKASAEFAHDSIWLFGCTQLNYVFNTYKSLAFGSNENGMGYVQSRFLNAQPATRIS